jgi:hypothetical protein
LESTLHRKIDLKDSVLDKTIFLYWYNFLRNNKIELSSFGQSIEKYEIYRFYDDYRKWERKTFIDHDVFWPFVPEGERFLPEDMFYGIKNIQLSNIKNYGGLYNKELQTVTINPDTENWNWVLAHKLTHHLDMNIHSKFEYYGITDDGYSDLSTIFYKIFDQETANDSSRRWEVNELTETIAYYFGDHILGSSHGPRNHLDNNMFYEPIFTLIATYLYGFEQGCGISYGYDPLYPVITFQEVRIKMEEAKSEGENIPAILEEALDAIEIIFTRWRKNSGFGIGSNSILEQYENISFEELKNKIKTDFPTFYKEVMTYGMNFSDSLMDEDALLEEQLQALKQTEFAIKRSFSFLPKQLGLLDNDIPATLKIRILGYLAEKLQNILENPYISDISYSENILDKFFEIISSPDENDLNKAFLCLYFADLISKYSIEANKKTRS